MCTVGGPVDIEFEERLKPKSYKCRECGSSFNSIGKNVCCPTCGSDDVVLVS